MTISASIQLALHALAVIQAIALRTLGARFLVRALLAYYTFGLVIAVNDLAVHRHKEAFDLLVTLVWTRYRAVLAVRHEALAIDALVPTSIEPVILHALLANEGVNIAPLTLIHFAS